MEEAIIQRPTLRGLPDELLLGIIQYACATEEAVNLGPETMRQDVRLHMEHVSVQRPPIAGTQAAPLPDDIENELAGVGVPSNIDLFFRGRHGLIWIGIGAQWIKHLEVIMPIEPRFILATSSLESRRAHTNHIFAHIRRAFPLLETLIVRVTTYRIGEQDGVVYDPTTMRFAFVSDSGRVVVIHFFEQIRNILSAMRGLRVPNMKTNDLVLFQEAHRDWRTWRDGPLCEPFARLDRAQPLQDGNDVDGLVWRMMDFPSCRVRLHDGSGRPESAKIMDVE